jgi:predicted nuclease with TOPRIM domain
MSSTIVELENEIKKIQEDMKQIHTELSILTEYYGHCYELMNQLTHQKKQELDSIQGFSLLNYENQESQSSSPKKLDVMLQKCVSNIIKDYYQRGRE